MAAQSIIIEQERCMEAKNDKKYYGVAGVVFNTAVIHTLFLHKILSYSAPNNLVHFIFNGEESRIQIHNFKIIV